MTRPRRPIGQDDLAHLEVEEATGDLYWRGRRLQYGGWTRADRLALWAMIVAAVVTLGVNHQNLSSLWDRIVAAIGN
jgi:hypothetical protein